MSVVMNASCGPMKGTRRLAAAGTRPAFLSTVFTKPHPGPPRRQQELQQRRLMGVCVRVQQQQQAAGEASRTMATDATVEEVMNPHPVLLQSSMPIKDAVHKLLDANVAGAPVVDEAGGIVGLLSESDLIWKGAGKPEDHFIIPPVFIGALDAYVYLRDNKAFEEETHKILARTVADAMVQKAKVISVTPETPMADAAQLMLHHNINLLPVVEAKSSKVVGILTRHDILRGIYAQPNPLL